MSPGVAESLSGELYAGTLTGTSADAIDAVLVNLSGQSVSLLATASSPIPAPLKRRLLEVAQATLIEPEAVGEIDRSLGLLIAQTIEKLLDGAGTDRRRVRAIGSHGQTIRHRPPRAGSRAHAFTWQIGDPNTIAELTGICTVADFRRRDIAAGGQGAPLVPAFHAYAFRSANVDRAIVNIGGMANVTLLPAHPQTEVSGFDTGPGNVLLDEWARRHLGTEFDDAGAWARSGTADRELLARLLAHPYLALPPPKSTGREEFNIAWLDASGAGGAARAEDVQASLAELTVLTIEQSITAEMPGCREIYVCGGGARNTWLMERLQQRLQGRLVASTAVLGIDPGWVEACLFAWLARCCLEGIPANLPAVTGAGRSVCLGGIYPGRAAG